ncbi:MAG: hypothetical protein MI920_14880 [Kiloniellales bacterium]|nr:hypothetical protein [Kiloniellales bacterium]
MAGDVGIDEQAIVVGATAEDVSRAALPAVRQARGRVSHQYGPRVLIAEVSPSAEGEVREQVPAGAMAAAMSGISEDVRGDLDEVGALGLQGFDLRQSEDYATAKAQRPLAEEEWDNDKASTPDYHDHEDEAESAAAMAGAPATSARLNGSVAVGVIIVEGPTAALKFSLAERVKVVAEVQNGLSWLGAQSSPEGVKWVYDVRVVSLNVKPGSPNLSFGQKEALWRDPAMAKLGYGAGLNGVRDYVQDLRQAKNTDWAYCAFFTKYPLGWFAYASIGGPRLVMDYANDGWGPDNIDRVFAHETGHVFGAPDEYAASNCNCGGQWGYFKKPNGNCATCAPGGGVPCIMKSNSWTMCEYTPYHLGFPQAERYTGVFNKGSGAYGLWANASWPAFVSKWKEWGAKGLRLEDLEITRVGNKTLYSGVWRQGSGGYGLWVNATWPSFVAKWKEWSGKGLRLIDLEITRYGSQTRYSGVFVQGGGGYGLWVNATWPNFVAKWKEWSGKGMRLIDFEITRYGSQTRYSGVFRQGGGTYGLWVNATWPNFVNKWKDWSAKGLRLIDFERTRYGAQTRYSGVFRQGSGGYGLWVNSDWTSFKEKWEDWSKKGLRLVDLEIATTGIETVVSSQVAPSLAAAGDADEGIGAASFALAEAPQGADESELGFGEASFGVAEEAEAPEQSEAGYGVAAFGAAGDGEVSEAAEAGAGEASFAVAAADAPEAAETGTGEVTFGVASAGNGQAAEEQGFGEAAFSRH